ncbi:MAG: ATP-binding protein [Symploca sp. SIO1A3]|nr:ATP-binding protein [Symploca sp. SIO1A3]
MSYQSQTSAPPPGESTVIQINLSPAIVFGAILGAGLAAWIWSKGNKTDRGTNSSMNCKPSTTKISPPIPSDSSTQAVYSLGKTISTNRSQLALEPLVLIYGPQGSGKSSKGGWLISEHLKLGHQVQVVNPVMKFHSYNGLKTWGKGLDYDSANQGMATFTSVVSERLKKAGNSDYDPFSSPHICLICDEVTNWESRMDAEIMGEFLEVCTQFLRQANASVIITSHGDTLTCTGGKKAGNGKADVLKRQFLRVECQAKYDPNIPGGKTCAGWAILRWQQNGSECSEKIETQGMLPPNPDYDYSSFAIAFDQGNPTPVETTSTDRPEDKLLQAIWEFAIKQGKPIKARDIQRANLKLIKNQGLGADEIREALTQLTESGFGILCGEGSDTTFAAVEKTVESAVELIVE